MMVSLDTNVVVRLFIEDNPKQTMAAQACLEKYDQVAISDIAIVETVYTLADWYKLGREVAVKCIETLLAHPKVNCNRALLHKALPMYLAHPALSFEDCCMAVYAHLNQAEPLLTFDRKFAKQAPYAELLAA